MGLFFSRKRIIFRQLCFDAVFHAVAGAFNYDGLGMMKKSMKEDGRGNSAIAVEDRGPLFEGFIRGNNDGTAFVSLADDLEKQWLPRWSMGK